MVSLTYDGRLGNNLIQYFVTYFFAKKFNLYHNVKPFFGQSNWGKYFNIKIHNQGDIGNEIFYVNDDNFLELYNQDALPLKHYMFIGFFQYKNFLNDFRDEIKNILNINYTPIDNSQVFIHYRIGDIADDRRMLPIEYYEDAISKINFNSGYISSDTIEHDFCKKLISKYNLIPFNSNSPIDVINFAKNFKNIVLSDGTFSWWIGFLSDNSNVFCNERNYKWFGDIFLNDWYRLYWDYDINYIENDIKIIEYKPIKIK